ncbi:unnamed protein product [Alternaria alternata]
MTVILFEDAKRTEPFARLAQAPSEGVSAYGTVLQTPRAWWAIFLDIIFRRKSVGKTSWCLVCTAFINVMALLAISPLSSALLTSEEVVITKALDLSKTVPRADSQLPIVANRETYFRTMSSLMRNLSTSVWIEDTSITLPFWPSTDTAQLGPNLVSQFRSWTAETTILHADLECQNMALESADLEPKGYKAYDVMGHGPYKGTEPMVTYVLSSDDGCRYEMSLHPAADLAANGGLKWSNTSTLYVDTDGVLPIGKMPFPANVSSTSPYARHNATRQCADRDIIILSTPWTKVFEIEMSGAAGSGIELNRTYERSPDFRMKALLCQSQYSLEDRNVTASIGNGKEPNITSIRSDNIHREPVTKALIDIPMFESMTLRDTWKDYFNAAGVATDAESAFDGYEGPYSNENLTTPQPSFFGLGPLLGALYMFNVTRMLDDEAFIAEAARVKGRFFTECLREALSDPGATAISIVKGEATTTEDRIINPSAIYRDVTRTDTDFQRSRSDISIQNLGWSGYQGRSQQALDVIPSRCWERFLPDSYGSSPSITSKLADIGSLVTVSMSALFERQAANISDHSVLERTLELRQIPIINTVTTTPGRLQAVRLELPPFKVLDSLLLDPPRSWLPGAAIQLSLNGTKPSWTHDGWSFVPLNLASILQPNDTISVQSPNNVTLTTSAIRARLECEEVPEVANTSTWLIRSNDTESLDESYDLEGLKDYYSFNRTMFYDSPSNTSAFATDATLACCSNETNGDSETAVIGYWSPVDVENFSNANSQWPIPFVTKWIVGRPLTVTGPDQEDGQPLLFKDAPDLQAARCVPIVETADAKVVVDQRTGTVHSYEVIGSIDPAQSAWSEVFVRHALTYGNSTQHYDEEYDGPLNITTSYGVLFMGSMFRAADPTLGLRRFAGDVMEPLYDNSFVMRDREIGMNMDLMTYSMYSLAKKDPQALLDYATLVAHADQTFQTFFQHFISHGLSLDQGGLGYQRIGDNSTDMLGAPVTRDGRALPQREYVERNTNRTVEVLVSRRIQVLHLNSIATYLSVAIIIWLVGTTAVVSCLQRKYTNPMIRDVQLIADVLVLVAGSDQLMRLVEERGVGLKKANDVKAMLGWFKGRDGEGRWGIEVVGGSEAVEWVDAPKTGWHAQSCSRRRWFSHKGAKS